MARELQPCGTTAAYQRHRRRREDPCDDCKRAWREAKAAKMEDRRGAAAAAAREAMPAPSVSVDRDDVLHEVLRTLRGQLAEAPPQSVAGIAKQIRDTLDAMGVESANQSKTKPDELSDIAKRYQEKRANFNKVG